LGLKNRNANVHETTSVGRIASALPNLTQHDISHLDALWETATLIAGKDYPINPLEAFVFGGAILLHDSALSFEAYSGGITAIRSTIKWQDAYHRLRPITEAGKCFGLAALSTRRANTQDFLNVATVGGLATSVHHRGRGDYFGFIVCKPKSAKRDQGEFAAPNSAMQTWVEGQFEILKQSKLTPEEQCIVATGLPRFGVDPSCMMRVCVGFEERIVFLDLRELTSLLDRMHVAIVKSSFMEHADVYSNIFHLPNRALIRPYGSGDFYDLAMMSGVPKKDHSVIGCIHRALLAKGKTPRWTLEKNVAHSPIFGTLDAVVVSIKPT